MAEGVLADTVGRILESLGSRVFQEIGLAYGIEAEISKLKDTVCTIEAVLLDAEEQHSKKNRAVTAWLSRLKDAFYDADDLLDDFSTELLQRRMMSKKNKLTREVSVFFSKSNQIAYGLKMGNKIKTIRQRLDQIKNDRHFHLTEHHYHPVESRDREQTHSFVRAEEVIGRDDDKNAVIQLLLNSNVDDDENVSIIPIVGIGGVGKTTLVQSVYNDDNVLNYFQLRIWVCVSDVFDVKVIVEKIIKSETHKIFENLEMEQLQKLIRKKIDGKKYLLVLDDLWNEDRERWLRLKTLLMNGAKGSRIIVTTRNEQVAKVTTKSQHYVLKALPEDMSWSLFTQMAFEQSMEPKDSKLVAIGKEIAGKCGGVPLVIRAVGNLLYSKNEEAEWSHFRDNILSKMAQESDILSTLKLSYDHLPSHLKQCFAYCALFPKDYLIEREELINLWMAQGFLHSSNNNQCLEDVGNECFMSLLSRSFFQDVEHDRWGNIFGCRMHDLMHDLARLVTGTECTMATLDAKNVDGRARHVSFDSNLDSSWKIPPSLLRAKSIRTFYVPIQLYFKDVLTKSNYDKIISNFRCLRMLDLSNSKIKKVPDSIGKLKHLRYLDLSYNKDIKRLPGSLSMLVNLQTLKLSGCIMLEELPRDIENMEGLRHLLIEDCKSLTNMPIGLGMLTSLQTLSLFVAGKRDWFAYSKIGELSELKDLNNLRGSLEIKNLGHMKNVISKPRLANLEAKRHLTSLTLRWDKSKTYGDDGGEDGINEKLLEDLQPHPNLKEIVILSFGGVMLSSWLSDLTNLTTIKIHNCKRCRYLPSLDQLPCLEKLDLYHLDALEYISEKRNSVSTASMTFFPSLNELCISYCPKLKGWWRKDDADNDGATTHMTEFSSFPCLSILKILSCHNLTSMPQYPSLEVLNLFETSAKILQQEIMMTTAAPSTSSSFAAAPLSKLKSLTIGGINDLESLPVEWIQNLTSLVQMCVMSKLTSQLSQDIRHLTSLENLTIGHWDELDLLNDKNDKQWQGFRSLRSLKLHTIRKLVSLPKGIQHVTTLQRLEIEDCRNLVVLPEWISNFTSLLHLEINYCPTLSERCSNNMGGDWSKIAHIPNIRIDYSWIQLGGCYKLHREGCSSPSTVASGA